jgi:hypothetical protein
MSKKRIALFSCLGFAFCLLASQAVADTTIIPVSEDEMVRSFGTTTFHNEVTNYNGDTANGGLCTGFYLTAGGLMAAVSYERFYLKFNLPSLSPNTYVSAATLYGYYNYDPVATDDRTHSIYLSTDGWSETDITWKTQPGPVGQAVDQFNPASTAVGSWQNWDVTNVTNQEYLGDGVLSLVFIPDGTVAVEHYYQEYFAEREFNPNLAFRLEITTSPTNSAVPIPSSLILFGSGILGVIGLRRKFRKG